MSGLTYVTVVSHHRRIGRQDAAMAHAPTHDNAARLED